MEWIGMERSDGTLAIAIRHSPGQLRKDKDNGAKATVRRHYCVLYSRRAARRQPVAPFALAALPTDGARAAQTVQRKQCRAPRRGQVNASERQRSAEFSRVEWRLDSSRVVSKTD